MTASFICWIRERKLPTCALVILVACPISSHTQQDETIDLKPLLRKWLKGERFPSDIISLHTFKKPGTYDGSEPIVKLTFQDLNRDGAQEIAIQSECAGVGNCDLRIFQRRGRSYRKLLSTSIVQTISLLKARRRGFVDLKLGTHNSAYDTDYQVFRFDGVQYRLDRCWNENWAVLDKKGNLRLLKEPVVSRGCN